MGIRTIISETRQNQTLTMEEITPTYHDLFWGDESERDVLASEYFEKQGIHAISHNMEYVFRDMIHSVHTSLTPLPIRQKLSLYKQKRRSTRGIHIVRHVNPIVLFAHIPKTTNLHDTQDITPKKILPSWKYPKAAMTYVGYLFSKMRVTLWYGIIAVLVCIGILFCLFATKNYFESKTLLAYQKLLSLNNPQASSDIHTTIDDISSDFQTLRVLFWPISTLAHNSIYSHPSVARADAVVTG